MPLQVSDNSLTLYPIDKEPSLDLWIAAQGCYGYGGPEAL